MSDTHYYYALKRKAADRVVGLTWNQFLSEFKWGKPSQWKNIGGYFAFGLEPPTLPEEPTPEQIAPEGDHSSDALSHGPAVFLPAGT